jgi:DNA primase
MSIAPAPHTTIFDNLREKEELESRWDVLELLHETGVSLKLSDSRKWGIALCCPYHGDHSYDLYVHRDFGRWKCFSCSANGDLWKLLITLWGCQNFQEAKVRVAAKYGVVLGSFRTPTTGLTDAERIQRALNWYLAWAEDELAQSPEALSYLFERGLQKETIQKFHLGYSPGSEVRLPLGPTSGVTLDDLDLAGLRRPRSEGGGKYRTFRNRILIPLLVDHQVQTLVGRTLDPEPAAANALDSEGPGDGPPRPRWAKYLNLAGREKSLLGLDSLGPQDPFFLLVEGPFDALLSIQAGVPTGALLGLNPGQLFAQLDLLPHHCGVVLALDADRRGQAALHNLGCQLMERGLPTHVLHLPEGEDPASLIRRFQQEGHPHIWK